MKKTQPKPKPKPSSGKKALKPSYRLASGATGNGPPKPKKA